MDQNKMANSQGENCFYHLKNQIMTIISMKNFPLEKNPD